jgi:hypothetical protein
MLSEVIREGTPLTGVNCKIKRKWKTLPKKYQGLAMPNVPLVALTEKVSFLLGNWGFTGQAHSNALVMAFDNFPIEMGLYGSPLDWSYKNYGSLFTESTWFHNLWTLVHYFEANITFCKEDTVQGLWENNCSLMTEFICLVTVGKTLSLSTLSASFITSYTCQTYPKVMAQHCTNLRSQTNRNSLLGTCSHKRNQRQQILGYGKMQCIIYALG